MTDQLPIAKTSLVPDGPDKIRLQIIFEGQESGEWVTLQFHVEYRNVLNLQKEIANLVLHKFG